MPHKCLRCGKIYSDEEMLTIKQCLNCGGRFFLYANTEEELLKKEELRTPEEKALGVAGEVEVKRVGDIVIVKKIKSGEEVEREIKKRKEKKKKAEEEKEKPKEIEKPAILEAPEPREVDKSKYLYGWKRYIMEEEKRKPQIEVNKVVSGIMEKGGIEDIKPIKQKIELRETEKPKFEEKPKVITMSDEEWLEMIFKDKIEGAVSMDIETLKILMSGKYEIDVPGLLGDKPVIASIREGTYYIDIRSAIEKFQKKKRE